MSKWIEPGTRVMDRAWLRDGDIIHTGEALALALLLHTRGKRSQSEIEHVAKMLNDPNQRKKR
jgi:hypothetical protein